MWYKSWDWEKDIKSLKASCRVCGLSLVDEAFSVIKTAASSNSEETETEPETPNSDPETPAPTE